MNDNFSMQIRDELCTKLTDRDKKSACLYGLLLFSHRFANGYDTSFRTECASLARMFPSLVSNTFGSHVQLEYRESTLKDGSTSYTFRFSRKDALEVALDLSINPVREIDLTRIDNNSVTSFVSGVFLACGSVSDPSKDYHLEFCVLQEQLADDLVTLLKSFGLEFRVSMRRGFYVVYVKGSENIEDVLTFMGAESATLEIMNLKIFKSVRNRINRRSNCEKANYTRSYNAIQKQFDDIEYIDSTVGVENLPEALQETVYVRLENPDMPLSELCQQFKEPIGRSGLSRRLQKLSTIARKIRDGTYDGSS